MQNSDSMTTEEIETLTTGIVVFAWSYRVCAAFLKPLVFFLLG